MRVVRLRLAIATSRANPTAASAAATTIAISATPSTETAAVGVLHARTEPHEQHERAAEHHFDAREQRDDVSANEHAQQPDPEQRAGDGDQAHSPSPPTMMTTATSETSSSSPDGLELRQQPAEQRRRERGVATGLRSRREVGDQRPHHREQQHRDGRRSRDRESVQPRARVTGAPAPERWTSMIAKSTSTSTPPT